MDDSILFRPATCKEMGLAWNGYPNRSCRDCVGSYPSRERCFATSASRSAETSSTTDCVRQARPKEVLRPSCKPACQRTAFFLKASLPTDCVLASLRQAVRSALRSDKLQGVRFAQPVGRVVLVSGDATMWQLAANHAGPAPGQVVLVSSDATMWQQASLDACY